MTDVTLYRRRHCGLCDDALFALRQLGRTHRFTIVERDIDGDPHLRALYDDVIPVVAIGDIELARAPIASGDLRAAIEAVLKRIAAHAP